MDGSRIAVGFVPYYTGALMLPAFLLRLGMKAACGEGAVLHYLSLSPVWDICSSIRQSCVQGDEGLWAQAGAVSDSQDM